MGSVEFLKQLFHCCLVLLFALRIHDSWRIALPRRDPVDTAELRVKVLPVNRVPDGIENLLPGLRSGLTPHMEGFDFVLRSQINSKEGHNVAEREPVSGGARRLDVALNEFDGL